jgi:hypothetical protein
MLVKKIVSGGQTGADQAALDFALAENIPHGGWIPKGRLTEKGPLPAKYQLQEMATDSYPKRTEQNVIDSDGTLIISHGRLTGGSALTLELAVKHTKPHLHLDMEGLEVTSAKRLVKTWAEENNIEVLNVAGPKISKDPRIYDVTIEVLRGILG